MERVCATVAAPVKARFSILPSVAVCFVLPLAIFLSPTAFPAENIAPADLSGTWELSWSRFGETNVDRELQAVDGQNVTGRGFGNLHLEGTINAERLELKALDSNQKTAATLTGRVEANKLSGDIELDNKQRSFWTAERPVSRPSEAPKFHRFEPTHFYNHFSAAFPAVLRLFPGDTVHTETVDAGGVDKSGV